MLRRGTKQQCRACGEPLCDRSASFCDVHRLEHNEKAKGRYKKNPSTIKKRIKLSTHRARVRALQLLGGLVCAGCNERDYRVLTIDHVDGVTEAERKVSKNRRGRKGRLDSNTFYFAILRGDVEVKSLRVLCMNCQVRNEHRRGNRRILAELIPYILAAGGQVPPITLPC